MRRLHVIALVGFGLVACGGGDTVVSPAAGSGPVPAPEQSVRFTVDSGAGRHPISPYIYGVNQADWTGRTRRLRLGRLGGNRFTAYNWETNASNAGSDFRHQNDDFLGGGDTPGEAVRPYIAAAHAVGASVVVTVPMAGYVAADKSRPGDVNQTPDYLNVRFRESRPRKGRGLSYPPDPSDRTVYQDEFVAWLEAAFPYARQDTSRTLFYCLDNEPDLWAFTHARIRPMGKVTYEEMISRTLEWASAIKAVAPGALVFGPVSYGWNGYVSLQDAADRNGRDFLDVFLDALRDAEGRSRRRLLDVLDLHWYPEARGGGVRITEPSAAPDVAPARAQAPRSLWDPSFVESSWISIDAGVGASRLIPRLKEKIASRYPGTRLAFTEYSYGGGNDISGAIAQADVLGIFGREDVFAAALWQDPARFTDAAFYAFVDYDGAGGRFGDTSIAAVTSNHAATSVYASVDDASDDRMTLVALNKSTGPTNAEIVISHPVELIRGRTYQITGASPTLIPGPTLAPTARNTFTLALPPSSVTTMVLTR